MATCEICSKEFIASIIAGNIQKTCSKPCKYKRDRQAVRNNPERLARDRERRNQANKKYFKTDLGREAHDKGREAYKGTDNKKAAVVRRTLKLKAISKRKRATKQLQKAALGTKGFGMFINGPCIECGLQFTTLSLTGIAKFCSDSCSDKESKRKRRAIQRQAFVETVYARDVYERDDFICQICFLHLEMDEIAPHYFAPTMDHIIPLAKGGSHSLNNIQSAHFICNARKRDLVP